MRHFIAVFWSLVFLSCSSTTSTEKPTMPTPANTSSTVMTPSAPTTLTAPTVADAETFIKEVETAIFKLWDRQNRAAWVKATYITDDSELLSAQADEAVMEFISQKSSESVKFQQLNLPPPLRRKFDLLRLAVALPAPRDAAKRAELARIGAMMDSEYGKGKYCPPRLKGKCLTLNDLSDILAKSRNYDELLEAWVGWHKIAPPLRKPFSRYVELANEGARELGFSDLGVQWRSRYDMPPQSFADETERLWQQVKPLYNELHCYARAKLQQKYGVDKVPVGKPIPAHLLGNMWSQEWGNIFDLLAPKKDKALDLEKVFKAKKIDEQELVRYGERFFTSLGLDPLPKTFWARSMFVKPRDREVVCHASAWDVDNNDDVRIKMCIKTNEEDFTTIHHELGHNYYQLYYRHLDPLYRDSANDGFHEALGDLMVLSVTPDYLVNVGLVDKKQLPKDEINTLLARAIEKVAFLPFGLLIDRWRWDVFSGKIKPSEYNSSWWKMRTQYQGVAAPMARTEEDFDAGAKYHIPANVPYTRYFLADILQFQFHRALCKAAGHKGPLHTCSLYQNKEIGKRIATMMEMGVQKPWPEALKALTGEDKMDASAIIEYFAPLQAWLKEQNQGKQCGW